MNANAQTTNNAQFTATAGMTSILVIGAALIALGTTLAAVAYQVAVPMVGMVSGIVSALA